MSKKYLIALTIAASLLPLAAFAQSVTPPSLTYTQVLNAPDSGNGIIADFEVAPIDPNGITSTALAFPPNAQVGDTPVVPQQGGDSNWYFGIVTQIGDPPIGTYNVLFWNISLVGSGSDTCANDINNISSPLNITFAQIQSDCTGDETAYGISYINFDVTPDPPPPASVLFNTPSTTAPALTAEMSGQFSDKGLLAIIGLAAGIPLVFYVIRQLLFVLPARRRSEAKIKDLNDRKYF